MYVISQPWLLVALNEVTPDSPVQLVAFVLIIHIPPDMFKSPTQAP